MTNWASPTRWNNILALLNQKRADVEKEEIEHTFSGWIKQSDINTLRNGLLEILSGEDDVGVGEDWTDKITFLNQKREDVGLTPISVPDSTNMTIEDILYVRNKVEELLPEYGFTSLSDALESASRPNPKQYKYTLAEALHAVGYDYDTWKTWEQNWIADRSLNEIEKILDLLVVEALGWSNDSNSDIIAILNLMYVTESTPQVLHHDTYFNMLGGGIIHKRNFRTTALSWLVLKEGSQYVFDVGWVTGWKDKFTVHCNSLPSNINVLKYYMPCSFSILDDFPNSDTFKTCYPITEEYLIGQIPISIVLTGGDIELEPPYFCYVDTFPCSPTLKYAYHTSV